MTYRIPTRCLACGSENLRPYFKAPPHPPANALRAGVDVDQTRYPLGLNVCIDCWHSQNVIALDPEMLFADYPYVSGTSKTLRDYFETFVTLVENDMVSENPDQKLRVLDIAANDGSLLAAFKARGHEVLGVDPAANLTAISEKAGVTVLPWLWERVPEHKLGGKFDVIIAMNVLAHVENPALFLRLARLSLKPYGRLYVQTSQAKMIERGEFDTVYHEHLSFFTARSLDALIARCGLTLLGIDHVPIHGTSYLASMMAGSPSNLSRDIAITERAAGYYDLALYDGFQARAVDRAVTARTAIDEYRARGYRVIGYGAAAKAITFLNFAGIELDAIVDENPMKIGRFLPLQDTQIVPLDSIIGDGPILWVIGAWNFKDEIMGKIHDWRPGNRDAFMTWFPEVSIEDPEQSHD